MGKSHSSLYHSACIWGVEVVPETDEPGPLPPGSFLTCSSDDTVRVWGLPVGGAAPNGNIYSDVSIQNMCIYCLFTKFLHHFNFTGTTKNNIHGSGINIFERR